MMMAMMMKAMGMNMDAMNNLPFSTRNESDDEDAENDTA